MNRSWITTGRRPNGLCGAAILIAAKIHGLEERLHKSQRLSMFARKQFEKGLMSSKKQKLQS